MEGEASYRYWSADADNHITIFNETQPELTVPIEANIVVGQDAFAKMNGFDLVVRTAGLAPHKIITDGKIWSATNEFFASCPCRIIGVTGTKGKGTTASLITSILQAAGKKVWLVGNIGRPALDILANIKSTDIVVYELSSFQLWDLEKSPQTAVVLMIEPDHLNVHIDMAEYINAKANITKYQNDDDLLVYNQNNDYAVNIANGSNAIKIGYMNDSSAHVDGGYFYYGEQKICSVNTLKIVGKHNYDNACAAIDAIWGVTNNVEFIVKGLGDFNGLDHRLKFVREINDVKYYDDSIATTPGSAIAALRAFDQPKVIILGGSSKGSDFSQLGREIARHQARAILIGESAELIVRAFEKNNFLDFEIVTDPTMPKIVNRAHQIANSGDVVILSPASASFGLFKNYADRGNQFINAVERL